MVKLIAADMDGTLLDDQKRLPNGFPKLLECLAKRGVAFAVASGRSYPALHGVIAKVLELLTWLPLNLHSGDVLSGELVSITDTSDHHRANNQE